MIRYDQLADRWLIVMPLFRRSAERPDQAEEWVAREEAYLSPPGVEDQPGPPAPLLNPHRSRPLSRLCRGGREPPD